MPTNSPTLFGPNGKPLAYGGLYPSPRREGLRNYRPRSCNTVQDTRKNVTNYDWHEQLNYSRQLFAQLGNLGGAILQKNMWAFGNAWEPQYYGQNKAWGEEVEEWLREVWFPTCNVRGEPYDFRTTLFLDGLAQDVDGDLLWLYTKTERGFPQIQLVPAHRVATNPYGGASGGVTYYGTDYEEVKDGQFDGARIYNGIIFNRKGRAIGYRVIEDKSENEKGYRDIPAFNAQLLYEPEWSDQGRGIPRIGRTILDWFDLQDIDHFLKRSVKQDASIGILRKVKGGEAITAEDHIREEEDTRTDAAAPQKIDIEEIRGGEFWYLDADSAEDILPYKSDRPHPNSEAFVERLEHRGMFAVGWSRFLLDPTKIGGAPTRLITDLAKQSIGARQKTGRKRAKRAIVFAIATAMEEGYISKNYDDFWKFKFDMPAEITVDSGYEHDADRENLKIGSTNLAIVCQKYGRNWEEVVTGTAKINDFIIDEAKKLFEKHKGVISFDKCLELMTQRNPNGTPTAQQGNQQKPQQKGENETSGNTQDS